MSNVFETTGRPRPLGLVGGDTPPALDRMPPHDLAAEIALLGSMALDAQVIGPVCMLVSKPSAFFKEQNQVLFQTIVTLFEKNVPIDSVVLTNALKTAGVFELVGGFEYLEQVYNSVPS